MKQKLICFISIFALIVTLFPIPAFAESISFPSAASLGKVIQDAIPTEFGYIENTQYYLKNYFSDLNGVDDCYIATSAASTNFNEFGIFRFQSKKTAKDAKKMFLEYLERRKEEFESGVIYNVDEYPKFQNASVFSAGNYVCYTILTPGDVKKASSAIRNMILK